MKIYVCVKHVPDTAARITILGENRIDERVTFIMNPYDENAIEEAARIKNETSDAEVIAVTLGSQAAEATLQSALAMGADRGILIKTEDPPDSMVTAAALKAAIESDGQPGLIFTGKESIDSEGFQTMYRLAAGFSIPAASNVVSFSLESDSAVVECEMEGGSREVIEMSLPCVIGAGKSLNKPNYPTLPDIMKARKKEMKQVDLKDLGFGKPTGRVEALELKPAVEDRQPKEITGTPDEVAVKIVRILKEEARVLHD
ncbi:MAG: electron transfer flavoprotein subunit beta/FixA family protein [Deltaproteobacteria bacterium]